MRYLRVLLLVLLAALTAVSAARANVTLVSFTATPGNGQVTLNWETATEIDTAGFFIRRSESTEGVFNRVSDFIPAEGDSLTGATYEYVDDGLTGGTTYYYQLEAIDYDQSVEFFGPISATLPGGAATSTPTATSISSATPTATSAATGSPTATETPSSTRTPTRTPTPTPTRTPTRTRVPSKTPTPRPHYTPTPTFTPSPIPPPTRTPTREFFSPPSPTLPGTPGAGGAYPPPAESPTAVLADTIGRTSMPTAAPSPTPAPAPAGESTPQWGSARGLALILVALLWLLLAAWLVYFVRKVGE